MSELFTDSLAVQRAAGAAEAQVPWEKIPAKGAVYLLTASDGGEERPLLLATVGDLRAALKRRFTEPEGPTRRIAYARVCTHIHWRQVDSSFAANWWYGRAVRELFPETAAALLPWRTTWWIGLEHEGPFPRLRKTNSLADADLRYAGPIRDKHAAARLIETLEDLFDLCRYHSILLQAPRGKACAYKEMGKCPAPCDGSVPLDWYRAQMDRAWEFLIDPRGESRTAWKHQTESQMKAAAARLEFETANRIKQRLARAGLLEGRSAEPYAHLRSLADFSFIALQPGKGKPWLEPWLIHGGRVRCLPQVNKKQIAPAAGEIARACADFAKEPIAPPLDSAAAEQMALVAHHLFRGEDDHGIYLRGHQLGEDAPAAIAAAAQQLWSRKSAPKPLVEQSSENEPAAPPEEEILPPSVAPPPQDVHPA